MDTSGMQHHINKVRKVTLAHELITLLGRFIVETGSRNYLQTVVNKTS